MFRRTSKLYRRARRYGKKRLGLSFVQKGSRARYGTKSSVTWPFSKKRSSSAAFSQNLAEDDWKEMGMKAPQSGGQSIAPMSMVRFKNPASAVFDYHHMVRRYQATDLIVTGATGAEIFKSLDATFAGLVSDYAAIAALYNRYRITRIVWQFIPQITSWVQSSSVSTKPSVISFVNRHSDYTAAVPGTFADGLDDCECQMHDAGQPFVIDYAPFCMSTTDIIDAVPATVVVNDGRPAPWIETSNEDILHIGGRVIAKVALNTGAAGVVSQQFTIFVTTYFDVDNIK